MEKRRCVAFFGVLWKTYKLGCHVTKKRKMTGVCIKSYPHFKNGDFGRKVTFQPSYPQCPQKLTTFYNAKTHGFKHLFVSQTDEKCQKKNKNALNS